MEQLKLEPPELVAADRRREELEQALQAESAEVAGSPPRFRRRSPSRPSRPGSRSGYGRSTSSWRSCRAARDEQRYEEVQRQVKLLEPLVAGGGAVPRDGRSRRSGGGGAGRRPAGAGRRRCASGCSPRGAGRPRRTTSAHSARPGTRARRRTRRGTRPSWRWRMRGPRPRRQPKRWRSSAGGEPSGRRARRRPGAPRPSSSWIRSWTARSPICGPS